MSESQSDGGVPPFMNKVMTWMLRSPLHRIVSKNLLLITFTGRKSGKVYTTPVSYCQQDDRVTIFTHANWWKNLRGDAMVTLRLQGRDRQGQAVLVADDKHAIADELATHLQKTPFDAKFYDVSFDDAGVPRPEDVLKAVETVVMIQVKLC